MTPKHAASRCTIGEICDFESGNGFRPEDWASQGLPIIRIQNLNGSARFNYFAGEPDPRWIVEPGDLLFAWAGVKGVSFGPTIWRGPRGVLNQHIYRIRPRATVCKQWLFYALRQLTADIEAKAHGFKSSLVHVRKSDITDAGVMRPTVEEQSRVAITLEQWDRAFDVTSSLIACKEVHYAGLVSRCFGSRQGSEVPNAPIRLISQRLEDRSDGEDYPLLTISAATGFVRQEDRYSRYMAGESAKTYTLLRKGEFAYNKGNSKRYEFGCVYQLRDYDAALVPSVYVSFRLHESVSDSYMRHLFASDYLKPQLRALVKTGVRNNGLLNISPDEFMSVTVPLPPREEQDRIGRLLDAASQEIDLLKQQLDAVREQRRGLMQKLLTGEWRLPATESAETTDA